MVKSAKIQEFSERSLNSCPYKQFHLWYLDAQNTEEISYPHAFTLSTLSQMGYPEGRIVLMKDFSEEGFVFYTNKLSQKGMSIKIYNKVGANFYWDSLGRQVRFYGKVYDLPEEEADSYFYSRSRESQLSAWASNQSQEIESRAHLVSNFEKFSLKFEGENVKRPPHWGGYLIKPEEFEFWTFGNNRLHDRFNYERKSGGFWHIRRLQP